MQNVVVIAIFGFAAQLIDGALGMGYGVSSTTLLLAAGSAPAAASATVHLAEVGTTAVSGVAHHRFGNVDWRLVLPLAIPGAVFAFLGAVVLSSLDAEAATPWIAGFLLILGVYIFIRFALRRASDRLKQGKSIPRPLLVPLGAFAGFMDAVGGGGWGPISTTTLVASERLEPRKAIGTVDTSEFLVAVGASAGFLVGLANQPIKWSWVAALLAGGLIAAPIAAWLVKTLNTRVLGAAVGVMLVVTNIDTILANGFGVATDGVMPFVYAVVAIGALTAGAVSLQRRRARRGRSVVRPEPQSA